MVDVRPAVAADIPELVRLRALFAERPDSGWGPPPEGDAWRERCAESIAEQLFRDTMRIAVVDGGEGGLAACGMGVVDQRLPMPHNPDGRVGMVFGLVTDPEHRHRGYARAIMAELLAWFDGLGVERVNLTATPEGDGIYRDLGFVDNPDPLLTRAR
ncbi:GNAT family N-acetyltransferase [Streptomonospora nanhaiensis]|uniref:GNAT superfamily N-acetyltransferase n=1 Tax=Streptomonospora nanhaiensis TaxID=1323731 RepID=A0A853BQN8_9ACTN|nr:GNAT family N-acetyltransferase [Streptomonospora nanhaiensis]MBV2363881.1 GNAT family N-acetyltransferase [Streptomonospora nanhaiensis]MBX9388250.1 GNAT family N-acetyltransferase [Streptomonospora nanhaiensis]NYI96811.1 GNAT superfamily N-acetyltransferase [Streptomonospora nanhaiensis]